LIGLSNGHVTSWLDIVIILLIPTSRAKEAYLSTCESSKRLLPTLTSTKQAHSIIGFNFPLVTTSSPSGLSSAETFSSSV